MIASQVDPVSGQSALKSAAVQVAPFVPAFHGFAIAARPFRPTDTDWATAAHGRGMTAELAGAAPADWITHDRDLFDLPKANVSHMADPARRRHRIAFTDQGRLRAALFTDRDPVAPARAHLATLLGTKALP